MVIDGDTIIVENIHIRLHGIDAEEMNEPNGRYAKSGILHIVQGNIIKCILNGEKSYNRYVGECYRGDIDIGADMVRFGYALDCEHYSQGKYRVLEPEGIRKKLIQKPYCR